MEPISTTTVVGFLTGPAGALILACGMLYGIYRIGDRHAVPMAKQWLDDNRTTIRELMEEHREDRELFRTSIDGIVARFQVHEGELKEIRRDVLEIKQKLD